MTAGLKRAMMLLLTLDLAVLAEPVPAHAAATLPLEYVDTEIKPSTGKTIHVPQGGDLQAALNTANLGDVIMLKAGATYTGPFLLPKKEGIGWVVVRTDAPDAQLQASGSTRVNPALAALMPRLVASRGPVLSLAPGTHHYRFVGVELSPSAERFLHSLVSPAVDPRSEVDQPHHVIFDRCYLHGDPARGTRRAIAMNGRHIAVIHSYLSDFKEVNTDSQALCGWSGSGPFRIVDNYLEGAAENVMFGGADPTIKGLVPSDIEIRGNTFTKNVRWNPKDPRYDGSRWTRKNLFELKNARRVLVEGNVFEDFDGFALVLTPRNQAGGAPWSTVEDVTIRRNLVRRVRSVLNISGYDEYRPSQPTRRVTVEDNVAAALLETGEPNPKMILINQGPDGVTIRHNTFLTQAGLGSSFLLFANAASKKGDAFAFTDNIAHLGAYGLGAENPPLGTSGATLLDGHYRAWTVTRNVLINARGAATSLYPVGQSWVSSAAEIGFVDLARLDLRLGARSAYKGRAADGRDPGASIENLREAFARFMSVPDPLADGRR